jgi:hypothetical protein
MGSNPINTDENKQLTRAQLGPIIDRDSLLERGSTKVNDKLETVAAIHTALNK